jgi:hypothetical protein
MRTELNLQTGQSVKIALTYDNRRQMDGAGSQLQRIYGIYALSKYLNIPYVHSPIKKIGYQGLSALENNSTSADLPSKYNSIFALASDIALPERLAIHRVKKARIDFLEQARNLAQNDNKFHLIKILYPYPITDRNPEIYRCLKGLSPFPQVCSDVFRIAIHVRRGELFARYSDRMLPNSYYIAVTLNLICNLKKFGIPFVCELYTEIPSKKFVVTPQHYGIMNGIKSDVMIDPERSALGDFDIIPNLISRVNLDPIETLKGMATADGLVMSRSSFSYVAALLNKNGIIIYHPFWHRPLKEWLILDKNGILPGEELGRQLETWKQGQSLKTLIT